MTGEPTGRDRDERIKADVDPEAFLRALLRLSPEDAADVRRIAAERTAKRQEDTDGSAD